MVNQQNECNKKLPLVQLYDHMFPRLCLYHFFMFLCPFWVRQYIVTGILCPFYTEVLCGTNLISVAQARDSNLQNQPK